MTPLYPYLTFAAEPAPGGRVTVTVNVHGPAHHWRDPYRSSGFTDRGDPSTFTIQGAAAIRDTWHEAAAEAFNHPATQEAIRAFEHGPVTVDYNEKWTPCPAKAAT